MSEPVELLLKSLKLPTFIRHYRALLDEQQDWAPVAYLTQLCEYELAERYQRTGASVDQGSTLTGR